MQLDLCTGLFWRNLIESHLFRNILSDCNMFIMGNTTNQYNYLNKAVL